MQIMFFVSDQLCLGTFNNSNVFFSCFDWLLSHNAALCDNMQLMRIRAGDHVEAVFCSKCLRKMVKVIVPGVPL